MNIKIKEVSKDIEGFIVAIMVLYLGQDFKIIQRNGKIEQASREKLPADVFNKHQKQFYAIFAPNKNIPKNRIFSTNKSKLEKARLLALMKCRTYVLDTGELCIIRSSNGKDIPQTYFDINSAIRAQNHILTKYFGSEEIIGELDKLHQLLGTTNETHELLLNWYQINDEVTKDIVEALTSAGEELRLSRDKFKKLSRDQIVEIIKMEDSLGRPNPGALATITVSAKDNFIKRITKIPQIALSCASRRHILILEKKQMELNIMLSAFRVKMILNSSDELFKNHETVCKLINQVLHLIQSVWLNPYYGPIADARNCLEKSKDKINRGQIDSAKSHLEGAKNVLKSILI